MPPRSRNWQSPVPPDRPRVAALSQALDLAQAPRLGARMRRQPLPQDVATLIRLAAGCRDTMAAAVASTARDPDFLRAAADLYLRQVVCYPGADPHRILGVPPQATRAEMRRQMRDLVLWLHPDRNARGGDRALMQRVLEAWQAVSGPGGDRAVRESAPPARQRRVPPYRPSWISRPVQKAAVRARVAHRGAVPFALRLVLVAAGLVIPSLSALTLSGLAHGIIGHDPGLRGGCPVAWMRTGAARA